MSNQDTAIMPITQMEQSLQDRQETEGLVDMQVATAKRYPRVLSEVLQEAKTRATKSIDIAASCFYVIPRAGKKIEGPSVRLAEIFAGSWGNLRNSAKIVEIGDKFVTAEATCWDMEKNLLFQVRARRKILDKNGRRYSEDMVNVTANAAVSIALRNALFRVIPRAFVDEVYEEAKRTAVGSQKTIDERKIMCLDKFLKMGFDEVDVPKLVDKVKMVDVDLDGLEELWGIYTAVRDGQISKDELVKQLRAPTEEEKEESKPKRSKSDEILDNMKDKKERNPDNGM